MTDPAAPRSFTIEAFARAVGTELGVSPWRHIDQDAIDRFADATGDHQWIHVDSDRAASGPFGTTIAHGFFTVSLLPLTLGEIYHVEGLAMTVNYGLNRLRFPSPVTAGSRIRTRAALLSLDEAGEGALQSVVRATVEIDGAPKPACVADVVARLMLEGAS